MNQFHIYEAIGHGKCSIVYKGRKKKSIEYFAIKCVNKSHKSKILQDNNSGWRSLAADIDGRQRLVSESTNSSTGLPTQLELGLLSPLYLRELFERLGATYIKLGQFIASTLTLFAPEYVEDFRYCFNRAPAVPFEEIQKILRKEFRGPIDGVFEFVDPTPTQLQ